jgi:hypothetical protein
MVTFSLAVGRFSIRNSYIYVTGNVARPPPKFGCDNYLIKTTGMLIDSPVGYLFPLAWP